MSSCKARSCEPSSIHKNPSAVDWISANDLPSNSLFLGTVTDVPTGERLKSETLTLDRSQSELIYPDLVSMTGEPVDRVVTAVARNSWKTFSPMTHQEDALLALPWFAPGASRIRQGNGFAKQGRWDLAEQSWQDVAAKHRRNHAAWNNLALASVAQEDFEMARDRIQHAKSIVPWDRAHKTERWIDQRQHNYHRALGLADREGGWMMPDPPPPRSIEETPSTEPQDIDELPWWTAIPRYEAARLVLVPVVNATASDVKNGVRNFQGEKNSAALSEHSEFLTPFFTSATTDSIL